MPMRVDGTSTQAAEGNEGSAEPDSGAASGFVVTPQRPRSLAGTAQEPATGEQPSAPATRQRVAAARAADSGMSGSSARQAASTSAGRARPGRGAPPPRPNQRARGRLDQSLAVAAWDATEDGGRSTTRPSTGRAVPPDARTNGSTSDRRPSAHGGASGARQREASAAPSERQPPAQTVAVRELAETADAFEVLPGGLDDEAIPGHSEDEVWLTRDDEDVSALPPRIVRGVSGAGPPGTAFSASDLAKLGNSGGVAASVLNPAPSGTTVPCSARDSMHVTADAVLALFGRDRASILRVDDLPIQLERQKEYKICTGPSDEGVGDVGPS